jgi:hypothetical protein
MIQRVELSTEEIRAAALAGVMRTVSVLQRAIVNQQCAKVCASCGRSELDLRWTFDIQGAIGELAVAKWSGRYWTGLSFVKGESDVVGLEVRFTPREDGDLILRDRDPDDAVYVLVTGALVGPRPSLTLRGCLWSRDGKIPEFRSGDCWRVPQKRLIDVEKLAEQYP